MTFEYNVIYSVRNNYYMINHAFVINPDEISFLDLLSETILISDIFLE
jgi:hypothetical protein